LEKIMFKSITWSEMMIGRNHLTLGALLVPSVVSVEGQMRRREFITILGGAAAAWSFAARAGGDYDKLPGLAVDLVRRNVAVIAALNTPGILAAKAATKTIPIVFGTGVDPVKLGLVESLSRSRGNVTGVTQLNIEMEAKRVHFFHELAPSAGTIALLINPSNPAFSEAATASAKNATRLLGLNLWILTASNPGELDTSF
jgi:putative ABC transport system substrate-binding protein